LGTDLKDAVIEEIPSNERILKKGMLVSMKLFGKTSRFPFTYAITEKGLWTRNPPSVFSKSVSSFVPYDKLDSFFVSKYGVSDCIILFPKGSRPVNRLFFEDHDDVVRILDGFLPRTKENEKGNPLVPD